MTATLPTAEEYEVTRILIPRVRAIAARLAEQAARMDGLADQLSIDDVDKSDAPYSGAVASRIQDLMNEMANLHLGGIISSAGTADAYRAKPTDAEETAR